MKLFSGFLMLVSALLSVSSHAAFRDPVQPGGPAGIWPDITFVAGADFKEFTLTIKQSRDEVRKELMKEFGDLLLPLVQAGAEAESAARIVGQLLLTFDGMHEQHKAEASRRLGKSIEAIFRAKFDQRFLDLGISDSFRRVEFVRNLSLPQAVHDAASASTPLPRDVALQAYAQVDFVMYGSFTIQERGQVTLTLTVEKYLSGQTRTFSSSGPINDAIEDLTNAVFDFFQSNQYPDWVNPQPQLQWIPSPKSQSTATAGVARMYCRGQGARLPFMREITLALAGTGYVPGGIGPFNDGEIYAVADRQRWNEQYYYYVGQEDRTGGAVRTDAGQGQGLKANYWCVRGPVADEVRFVEDLYQVWRQAKDAEIRRAIEYVLIELGDFGANSDYRSAYPNVDAALGALAEHGVVIHLPMNMRLGFGALLETLHLIPGPASGSAEILNPVGGAVVGVPNP